MQIDPKKFWCVSISDSALDTVAMGWADALSYVRERDVELLKFVPGVTPTKFALKRIPTSLFQRFVLEGRSESEQNRRAFMCGVEMVRDLVCTDGELRPLTEPSQTTQTPGGPFRTWSDEDMELVPPIYVEEIGQVAFQRSFLGPKARVGYRLPPSCLPALTDRAYHHADETPTDALPSNDAARVPPASPPDASGDAPTDAPATESPTDVSATLPTQMSSAFSTR